MSLKETRVPKTTRRSRMSRNNTRVEDWLAALRVLVIVPGAIAKCLFLFVISPEAGATSRLKDGILGEREVLRIFVPRLLSHCLSLSRRLRRTNAIDGGTAPLANFPVRLNERLFVFVLTNVESCSSMALKRIAVCSVPRDQIFVLAENANWFEFVVFGRKHFFRGKGGQIWIVD